MGIESKGFRFQIAALAAAVLVGLLLFCLIIKYA
jgi:hypothetical protein